MFNVTTTRNEREQRAEQVAAAVVVAVREERAEAIN